AATASSVAPAVPRSSSRASNASSSFSLVSVGLRAMASSLVDGPACEVTCRHGSFRPKPPGSGCRRTFQLYRLDGTVKLMTMTTAPQLRAGRREWAGLAVLMIPVLLISVDNTVLGFAIPAISVGLHPTGTQLLWIVD